MHLTGTHINYFHICHRKLWLFSNGITMEHTSGIVYDGKLLHETSYPQRPEKYTEIEVSATIAGDLRLTGKIDFYDAKEKLIHEMKRSDKIEEAHEWQVKYYIWLFVLNDISGVHARLEYPKFRQIQEIWLSEPDKLLLEEVVRRIANLQQSEICPPKINARICKNCSYYDLCYVEE
jgi:CRISPR-associated exonuclease Cas4